ncbi:HET-domain-containing protein [Cadophora sp. DSE1049]|nr:HET-domain-containing protein [Cadophora sp. DSE1049]
MGDLTALRQEWGAYQYLPLNEGVGEIRLLYLLPGPFSSPIRVVLESTPFSPDTPPQFEALSYTWGSAENPTDIFVGSSGYYTLAVTQNLAEALPYLRLEDRSRTLWIDAICVNQRDMAERTSQVKRMADIYTKAARVVVWLGPESKDSSMAIDLFNTICSNVTVDWQTSSFHPTSANTRWADVNNPVPLDQDQSNSISSLLSRPWFDRLWIWQEVRLPSGDTIVKCGHQTILWSSMCQAIYWLFRANFTHANYDLLKKRVYSVFNLCDRESYGYNPLTTLLDNTKHCECSDPRDRIFALLSLVDPSHRVIGIEADYSQTVSEVHKNAVLCTIKSNQNLRIVATAGLEQNNFGLPSWVPKWPCRTINRSLEYSVYASGESLAADIGDQGYEGILTVTGVSVATIDRTEGFELPEYGSARKTDIGHEIRRIARIHLRGPFEEGSKDLLAFCRTICADQFAEALHPQRSDGLSLEECVKALRFLLGHEENIDSWNMGFLALAGRYVCGRSFFVTKDGCLGLGPRAAEPGDIVTVLLGDQAAFILRPADGRQHQVVGEAYCYGFMDGEAFLGPLPGRLQLVLKLEEKTDIYWWGHIDRETESFYCQDPRLGELPSGWKRKEHASDKFWTWFVNEETGEEMKVRGDPRLTAEALKQRGVDLKVFKLV